MITLSASGLRVSPAYTVHDWLSLNLAPNDPESADWITAIAILRDRIEGRFLKPADELIEAERDKPRGTYGFAVMALDFLVIETIEGFRRGLTSHNGKSRNLFKSFLTEWPDFSACVRDDLSVSDCADKLYSQGRCALHHSGTTDRLRVRRRGEMVVFHADGTIDVNRTAFHASLRRQFDRYLLELAEDGNVELRKCFKRKMQHICAA